LVDIANTIAFAPPSVASDLILKGKVPKFLIDNMFTLMLSMTKDDEKFIKGTPFAVKVRELRHITGTCWNDGTWSDLDDVLRLLRDSSGPIGFRRGCAEAHKLLQDSRYNSRSRNKAVDYIIRFIRNEISAIINKESCFEAKRNALNALADMGIASIEHGPTDAVVWSSSGTAFLNTTKMLFKDERDTLLHDMPSIPELSLLSL